MDKQLLYNAVEAKASALTNLSDEIWEYAELSMEEHRCAAAHIALLKAEGFQVEENLCGIATAFSGTYGSGSPKIGILGEYDALSGLSQTAGATQHQPLTDGGCGHGCGHNLLGAGPLSAAYAVKKYLEEKGVEIVVGTPGRVKDHIERGSLKLDKISYFILDEADEMLDMGFREDIENIFQNANPDSRILLFSATMPKEILQIAANFMGEYEVVEEETKPEEPLLTENLAQTIYNQNKQHSLSNKDLSK